MLTDFNLSVKAGTTVALVGTSGSGKSTAVQLLERFYDPVSGDIFLDGTRLQDLNVRWLRQRIGLVQQEPVLFSGTIESNILNGLTGSEQFLAESKEQQRDRMIAAAKLANCYEFIMRLPKQFETEVGERGLMLSGGQKQRISIGMGFASASNDYW